MICMTDGVEKYLRYKIAKGMAISAEPLPSSAVPMRRGEGNDNLRDDAQVCLGCTSRKCSGSERCFRKREQALMNARKETKGNGKTIEK